MFDWVYDNLYVGDLTAIENQKAVRDEGITAIVRLDMAPRDKFKWHEDFKVLDTAFQDTKAIPDGIISKVSGFINEQIQNDQTVMVHCAAGISRSVTLTIVYLIEYEGMTLAEAFGTVREGRTQAYPHQNLLISLIEHYDLSYDTSKVINPYFIASLMAEV